MLKLVMVATITYGHDDLIMNSCTCTHTDYTWCSSNGGEYSFRRDFFDNSYFIHGRRLVLSSSSSRECSSRLRRL